MFEIIKSDTFERWLIGLKDRQVRLRVLSRVDRLSEGNPGDVKSVGGGISELRIDFGPGYRVYFMKHGLLVIVLLAGGDKRTQQADIRRAIKIAKDWKE